MGQYERITTLPTAHRFHIRNACMPLSTVLKPTTTRHPLAC